MNNTFPILLHWDKGQPFAERLAAKILGIEGFSEIDPQCPTGGPDGTKDLLCRKEGLTFVVGCYFANGQKEFSVIADKFKHDYAGKTKHGSDKFVFITNQKITPGERAELVKSCPFSEIYHGERTCGVLDSPKGYGVRLEYLGIELTKAEQISFLDSHLDLKSQFDRIQQSLDSIKKVTGRIAGQFEARDLAQNFAPCVLPIAGVLFSSRLSIEDLQSLHLACTYEGAYDLGPGSNGFRNVQVWVGAPGCSIENADYLPPPPSEIPRKVNELLNWWRAEYSNIVYSTNSDKTIAIALFHAKFLAIHPFLDGNGRLSRLIASLQYRDLLQKELTFETIENKSEYYKALQLAQTGDTQSLVDIFMSLAK